MSLIYFYVRSAWRTTGAVMWTNYGTHSCGVKPKQFQIMSFYQVRLRLEAEFHLDECNARSFKSSRIRCCLRKYKLISNHFNLCAIFTNDRRNIRAPVVIVDAGESS